MPCATAWSPRCAWSRPAVSWQIAARVVAAYDGPMDAIELVAGHRDRGGDRPGRRAGRAPARRRRRARGRGVADERGLSELPGKIPAAHPQGARHPADPRAAAAAGRRLPARPRPPARSSTTATRWRSPRGSRPATPRSARPSAAATRSSCSTSTRTPATPSSCCCAPCSAGGTRSPRSVTRASRSTAGAARARATCGGSGRDFPVHEGRPAPVLLLSTSFRNTGRVLRAAGALQAELRAAAPEVPLLVAPPARDDRGHVSCALLESAGAEAELGGRPGRRPARPGSRPRAGRRAVAATARRSRSARPTSPCCAASAPSSRPSAPRWRRGASRWRWSASAACSPSPRSPTSSRRCGSCTTRPPPTRWPGCWCRPGGGSARPISSRSGGAPARWPARPARGRLGGGRAGRTEPGDPLAQAVTDLTRDTGSLVEALDDLDGPAHYSPAAHARLSALAAELRALRSHVARPLPDLVTEVERALGLDIEVASRPGVDPASARADLDAFTDAAATFAGAQDGSTLGAFLAYLSAAEEEEFGLEGGRVGETDSVKLATVHAAKGLQWPAVIVPGLSGGRPVPGVPGPAPVDHPVDREPAPAAVQPARRRRRPAPAGRPVSQRAGRLHRGLHRPRAGRGAPAGLRRRHPRRVLAGLLGLLVGRRLVPPGPVRLPERGPRRLPGGRGERHRVGGRARAGRGQPGAGRARRGRLAGRARRRRPVAGRPRPRPAWSSRPWSDLAYRPPADARRRPRRVPGADGLLGQRGRPAAGRAEPAAGRGGHAQVALPSQLAVSALVTMARDPAELARQVRRPMPRPPAPHALRGTEFHRWLEERFGQPQLIDADELPGANDDPDGTDPDPELAGLKTAFEASEWADRQPAEVEVPFETLIGDRLVRGRIDAVFADAADGELRRRRLEDRPPAVLGRRAPRGRRPARRLPPGLGGAGGRPGLRGPRRVLLRPPRRHRPPGRPHGRGRPGRPDRGHPRG